MSKSSRLFLEEQEKQSSFDSYLEVARKRAVSKEEISIKLELTKLFESWGEVCGAKNVFKKKLYEDRNI